MMDRRTVRNNVEFYSKNKLEKLVHLVGFIIRIYHDAQLPDCVLESLADMVMQQSTHTQKEHVSVRSFMTRPSIMFSVTHTHSV